MSGGFSRLIPLQTNFLNSSLTSRFGFSSTASHEHASEEAKLDLRTGPFDLRGPRDGGGPIYLVRVRSGGGLARSAANASLCWRTLRGAGRPAYPPLVADTKSFLILLLGREVFRGVPLTRSSRRNSGIIFLTRALILGSKHSLTWLIKMQMAESPRKKLKRQPGDALVAWTRGNYKRKKTDTQPWDEVLVAWGGQGRVVGVTIAENNGNGLDLQEFLLHVVISSGA
ncbi:hypothetical protein HKD37_16G045223 [Glycine soja]